MKTAKSYAGVRRMRYYPEIRACLVCHDPLRASHPVWSKYVTLVGEVVQVTSMGCRWGNAACPGGRVVYRSAAAEALSLAGPVLRDSPSGAGGLGAGAISVAPRCASRAT